MAHFFRDYASDEFKCVLVNVCFIMFKWSRLKIRTLLSWFNG